MQLIVKNVMSKQIYTIKANATIRDAAEKMRKLNIGSLLVVEEDETTILGIISERDVLRAYADKKIYSKVEDYMTREVKGVKEDTSIIEALTIMLDNGFRHLPIVNDKGKVSGIVSIRDLVKALTDPHYYQFRKEFHEVKNSSIVCPVCGLEIDEYGYCGCGTGSG